MKEGVTSGCAEWRLNTYDSQRPRPRTRTGSDAKEGPRRGLNLFSLDCNLSDNLYFNELRRDESLPDEDALDGPFNHGLHRAPLATLEHVPDDTLHSLADNIHLYVDTLADVLESDDGARLRMCDEHDAERRASFAVVLVAWLWYGKGGEGEGGTVESDVALWDEGSEEGEGAGEEVAERVAVGRDGEDRGGRVNVALD